MNPSSKSGFSGKNGALFPLFLLPLIPVVLPIRIAVTLLVFFAPFVAITLNLILVFSPPFSVRGKLPFPVSSIPKAVVCPFLFGGLSHALMF